SLHNHPFSHFISVSGYPPLLNELHAPFNVSALANEKLLMINGGRDRLYPAERVNAFAQRMKTAGVPLAFRMHPKEGHGFDYRQEETSVIADFINLN
ncbi:MAG: dienelactone hydrolase family protein, partial [Fibrobacterota bacterium]